jgi:hypothetical protein
MDQVTYQFTQPTASVSVIHISPQHLISNYGATQHTNFIQPPSKAH